MSGLADYTENTPGQYNAIIEQGATWTRELTLKDSAGTLVNLTGCSAKMDIRQTPQSASALISLTTTNNRITLGGSAGTVTLTLTATDTASLNGGNYVFDLFITSGSTVVKPIEGTIYIESKVTV